MKIVSQSTKNNILNLEYCNIMLRYYLHFTINALAVVYNWHILQVHSQVEVDYG